MSIAPNASFLGTGWAFPPTFSPILAGAEMVSGELDIRQSLMILFGTRVGERIMRPGYGGHLGRVVFAGVTTEMLTDMKARISRAVALWEPRVDLVQIDFLDEGPETGVLQITLVYDIRGQNTRANIVFPFYLNEATTAGQAP